MAGGHLEPIAFYIGRWVFQFSLRHCNITSDLPRPLEPLAIEYLRQLGGIVDVRRAERHEAQQGLA
jgi:hypothetical protein